MGLCMISMVEEQGTVVSVGSNKVGLDSNTVGLGSNGGVQEIIVEVLRTSACSSCKAKQGCGQAVMSELGNSQHQSQKNHFRIPYDQPIEVGDIVKLGMASDALSRVALLVYLLPLFFAFLGISISLGLGFSEGFQLLFMVIGFAIAIFLMSRWNIKSNLSFVPKILQVSSSSKEPRIITSTS